MNKSMEIKNKLQQKLNEVSDNVDNIYNEIYLELRDEIFDKKEKIEKINEETNSTYNKLNPALCEGLIKKKLPLRVKLFNKINYKGKGIVRNEYILVYFNFNNNYENNRFEYIFNIEEIKKFLNKKHIN